MRKGLSKALSVAVALIVALLFLIPFVNITFATQSSGSTMVKSCQAGDCVKNTPRCRPQTANLERGSCEVKLDGAVKQGSCYASYDPPQGCLLNSDGTKGSQRNPRDEEQPLTDRPTDTVILT